MTDKFEFMTRGQLKEECRLNLYNYQQLLDTIAKVRAKVHADDMCWMPADMNEILVAMVRFIACLEEGGPWKTYVELEEENAQLKLQLESRAEPVTPKKSGALSALVYSLIGASLAWLTIWLVNLQ